MIEGIKAHHPRFFSIPRFFKSLDGYFFRLSLERFKNKIKQVDIIDSHFAWPDGYGSWLAAKKYKRRFSITLRGKDVSYWSKRRIISSKIKKMLNKADLIISVSKKLKKDGTKVIPNGVDIERFRPLDKKESRKRLNIDQKKKIFLTVGNDFRRKGYFELVKTFDRLDTKDKLLIMIGKDKKESRNLKNTINSLKDKDKIRLIKEINNKELVKFYSASDVYCLVSHSEGWPNSVMEALGCGIPCVVTKEAAGEFITGELGIVTDHKHLKESLEKALSRRWDKKKILGFIRKNTWDAAAKKVYEEFRGLLG
jgi:glycosyltransferase involved in cell wall biosynthesis